MPTQALQLIVLADAREVAAEASGRLLQAIRAGGRPLGLATGRTMERPYAALLERLSELGDAERRDLLCNWSSFNLDEYVGLGRSDRGSFAAAMERQLGRPLNLAPQRLRLPDGLAADPQAEARRYAEELRRCGGIGLQLLGLGLNGHVGFNEPPCGPDEGCRCVRLSASTRRQNAAGFGADPEAVPERAITLGLREILAAERILLLVTGGAKAAVLQRLLREPPGPELPASWLHRHPDVTVLADRAALG
ncbi:MAG: glucosamine-6-phosphate deaminase [Synechococcaceae cyanobacterium]|nr:glucosamine-6-phosphate deaminase [Synechococcaceae cyanobacterium]